MGHGPGALRHIFALIRHGRHSFQGSRLSDVATRQSPFFKVLNKFGGLSNLGVSSTPQSCTPLFVIRLHCCGLPAPARRQFFALRFATVCH